MLILSVNMHAITIDYYILKLIKQCRLLYCIWMKFTHLLGGNVLEMDELKPIL